MAMAMGGEREREERVRHTDRQTDRHTDRQRCGGRGGREGDLPTIAWERIRRGDSHTTQHDTIRHTGTTIEIGTGRDETWQGMAMHGDGDGRREGKRGKSEAHRQTDRQTDRGVAGEEGRRETYKLSHERRSEEETATPHNKIRYDTTHRNNDRDRHRTRWDMTGNGDAWRWRWEEREERVRHTDRHTDTQTEMWRERREGDLQAIAWERIRRGDSHTTQHDTIWHTGTTIEIGTGRDETWHDREWRCMAMAMGGEREREEREWGTQTDTQTDKGVAGEEGGRETYILSHERGSEEETATPHDTIWHRNNDRDRHRTRRDETWQGMAMHGDGDRRKRREGGYCRGHNRFADLPPTNGEEGERKARTEWWVTDPLQQPTAL
jgi:hypothetical protein